MHKNRFDELTSLMAKKDTKAFDLFYNEYGGFIYSVIKVVCKEKELTEEVLDDVLIKVWNLAHKLVHIENPEGWLYKVSRNTAINAVKVRRSAPLVYESGVNDKNIEMLLGDMVFEEIISRLAPVEQEVLIFKFKRDYTFRQIGEIMGKPTSTISNIYYGATKKLEKIEKNNRKSDK